MLADMIGALRSPSPSERDLREAHEAGYLDTDAATALVLRAGLEDVRSHRLGRRYWSGRVPSAGTSRPPW